MKHAVSLIGILLSSALCAATNTAPAPAVKTGVLSADESRIISGDSAVVITEKDFQRSGVRTVAQALATVPGVYVLSQGGIFGGASVMLRGAAANSVKVLLNGAELSGAANANLSADIAFMPIDGIEKIEVIFGPQSARFGTGANGGVINIIMKRGAGQSAELSAMGGMYDTWNVRAGMLFGSDRFDFSLSASQMNTHGFSAAAPANGGGDNDGVNNAVVAARLGFNPIGDVRFGLDMYYSDAACSVDDGAYADDTDRTRTAKNISGRISYSQTLTPWWKHRAMFQFSFSDILDVDVISSNDIYYTEARYRTGFQCGQWQSIFTFQDVDTLLFTLDIIPKNMFLDVKTNDAMGDSVISNSNNDDNGYGSSGLWGAAGIENSLVLNNAVYLTAAARMEWGGGGGSDFIMDVTYRISALIKAQALGLEARASAGNGKTLPAMFYGNYSQMPKYESVLGVDAGVRETFGTLIVVDVSGFYSRITNMIIYGIGSPANIAQALNYGGTAEVQIKPWDKLSASLTYTYNEAYNLTSRTLLLNHPRHIAAVHVTYEPIDKLVVNASAVHIGTRFDFDALHMRRVVLPDYSKVNLNVSYTWESLTVFVRGENLLWWQPYKDYAGVNSDAFGIYGGVMLRI